MENLDTIINESSASEGLLNILKHLRPEWDADDVVIEELREGAVNRMFRCALAGDAALEDAIIVRVYGQGTGEYIEREREILALRIAASRGIAPALYCRFGNGMAYRYQRGDTLDDTTSNDENVERTMARTLATVHLVDYKQVLVEMGEKEKIELFVTIRRFSLPMNVFVSKVTDEKVNQMTHSEGVEFPNRLEALATVEQLEQEFDTAGFSVCFCHNDAIPSNIVYDPQTNDIVLVDWELAGVDFPHHDLAVYFGGKCMLDECDEQSLKLYPSKDHQLKWIRWYLENRAELCGRNPKEVSEPEVEKTYRGSVLYSLMWTQTVAFYFMMQHFESSSINGACRKAVHFQRLFTIIKERQNKEA